MALNLRLHAFTTDCAEDARIWRAASTGDLLRKTETPLDLDQSKVWELCARRSSYRCEVSKTADGPFQKEDTLLTPPQECESTNCISITHMIPPILNDREDEFHVNPFRPSYEYVI